MEKRSALNEYEKGEISALHERSLISLRFEQKRAKNNNIIFLGISQ